MASSSSSTTFKDASFLRHQVFLPSPAASMENLIHKKSNPDSQPKHSDTMSKGIAIQEFTSKMVEELPKVLFKDRNSLLNLIKTCGQEKNIVKVRKIHMDLQDRALISRDVYLTTALIRTYTKCGAMREAREVFEQLPIQDVVSWTILMSGYSQLGLNHEALKCYKHMQDEGVCPDSVTYLCALKACGNLGSLEIGEDIDIEVRKVGFLKKDVMLGATLVDMYAKCGAFEKARNVLEYIPVRNVVCWTALIAGYVQHGLGYEALKCFHEMEGEGIYPNAITYACVLKACTMLKDLDTGKGIDADLRKKGLLHKDIVLGTALIDMYAHCGALGKARETFSELPIHDVVSWSTLITGYVEHGLIEEALKCFKQMQGEGVRPDSITYVCILKACGIVGCLEIGKDIDAEVRRQGLLLKDVVLGTTLVDMYAKCGALDKAQEVFSQLQVQDVVSWSAIMAGYAQLGQSYMVLDLLAKMRKEGIVPNLVTFLVLLTVCSHTGLMEEGERLFDEMFTHHLTPSLEHYTCMVDLFSRAGHFDKAKMLLNKVSSSQSLPLLLAILGACRKWVNVKLGRWTFERLVQLDEKCVRAYVCMESIYLAAGMQTEADAVEAWRVKNKAWKIQGWSQWTDSSRNVHSFENKSHCHSARAYVKLKEIHEKLSEESYSQGFLLLQQAIRDEERDNLLCDHSVQLAIACALINTHEGVPIHVTMKLRVCGDCHSVIKFMSMTEQRRILVADANQIHKFEYGRCIC